MYVTTCSMPRTERNPCPKEFTGQVQDYRQIDETESRHCMLGAYFLWSLSHKNKESFNRMLQGIILGT